METQKQHIEKGYSIIIPAYDADMFLEECLDSIENQLLFQKNSNYEILLGIDACKKTLEKAKKIKDYYKNLRVFYFATNNGPYIVKNSLIKESKYSHLLFFDSDDQMKKDMMSKIDKRMKEPVDICRFKYLNYSGDLESSKKKVSGLVAEGVVCHSRKVHEVLGGFESWRCAADTDFKRRSSNIFKVATINDPLFFRRVHDNSLTKNPATTFKSPIREKYAKILRERNKSGYYTSPKKVNIEAAMYEEIS